MLVWLGCMWSPRICKATLPTPHEVSYKDQLLVYLDTARSLSGTPCKHASASTCITCSYPTHIYFTICSLFDQFWAGRLVPTHLWKLIKHTHILDSTSKSIWRFLSFNAFPDFDLNLVEFLDVGNDFNSSMCRAFPIQQSSEVLQYCCSYSPEIHCC